MNEVAVVQIGAEALMIILKVASPIMMAGLVVGLIIALFQALTSIQEMTLTFVPKIIIIFAAVIFFMPFMMTAILEFTQRLYDRIIQLG